MVNSSGIFLISQNCNGMDPINPFFFVIWTARGKMRIVEGCFAKLSGGGGR
jgi:hypothetical protein